MKSINKLCLSTWLFLLSLSSCSEPLERPELINKLRTLGVKSQPAVYNLAEPVDIELIVYLTSPSADPLEISSYTEESYRYAPQVIGSLVDGSSQVSTHAALYVHEFRLLIPSDQVREQLLISPLGNFRYSVLAVQGSEQEKIVGNIVGSLNPPPELTEVSIVDDGISAAIGEMAILGKLPEGLTSNYRISWLASGGEIANRRSLSTKWKEIPNTPQTLILTARGTRTGEFAMDIRNYNQVE
jgi:hypothetical protein